MNKPYFRTAASLLALILAAAFLFSCTPASPSGPETNTPVTEAVEEDFPFPDRAKKRPSGEIDADAESLSTIVIRTAEDLLKIGTDAAHPLDGDYTLAADLDMTTVKNFTPIGGMFSECGIVSGDNVFSGTFDGRGHTIFGLTLRVSSPDRIHAGLFGTVASHDPEDPAVIRNLILQDVTVTAAAAGPASYAALIGQANGYVTLDNIALISGKVDISNDTGDLLGVASLIGQCRTGENTGCTNEGIHITNIFSNLTVIGENNGRTNYTSGLIGRIRGSNLGSLCNVIQLGTVTHEGDKGNAITAGDSGILRNKNIYYPEGAGKDDRSFGSQKTLVAITNASLTFDGDEAWHIERGLPPILGISRDGSLFSALDYLTIPFVGNENINAVTSDFTLPDSILGMELRWLSSNEKVIAIDGRRALVTTPAAGKTGVVLTAYTREEARDFTLQVISATEPSLKADIAGGTLYAMDYPAGTTFTWVIEGMMNNAPVDTVTETEGKLVLTEAMDNCRITLKVTGYDNLVYYYSSLPTLAITSPASIGSLSTKSYAKGALTVYTVAGEEKTEYDGAIEVKIRGNTTAYKPKRPLRLKLEKKTDLFGMGESKHWALLANYNDQANLRNKLAYDLGMALGLSGCESTFVNVIFNGEYQGLYLLCETVRVDEGRVEIFDWEETAEEIASTIAAAEGLSADKKTELAEGMKADLDWITNGKFGGYTLSDYYDTSGFRITGGYLIENDEYYDEASKFITENGMKMQVHSPAALHTSRTMTKYLKGYIQDMEDALYAPDRLSDDGKHYSEYMDMDSFLDFFMVNQFFKNVELFYKSCYMYKDVDGPIVFGPIWDMDWTSGNHVVLGRPAASPTSWEHDESQDREYWYRALYNDPWFMVLLCERWSEIQDEIDAMLTEGELLWERISDEAVLDHEFWKYPQYSAKKEVTMLMGWFGNRQAWMDEQMQSPEKLLSSFGYYIPSERLSAAEVTDAGDRLEITLSVSDTDTIRSCDILVNGTVIGTEEVSDGMVISVDKSLFRESGKYNSIEILGKKANGSYSIVLSRGQHNGSDMADSVCLFHISE